ncbi:MAG: P-loop NTPase [Armatimonadetes bacterium]|nr:P-loop NTPase [Armatimonadota bacterium]
MSTTTMNEDFAKWLIPTDAARAFVPADMAQKCRLLPLELRSDMLICAGADPIQFDDVSQLQFALQKRITIVRVPSEALFDALWREYGHAPIPELPRIAHAFKQEVKSKAEAIPPVQIDWASQPMKVITVASGSGGSGKTNTAINLATSLSLAGYKVALLDANFSFPNVHLAMGIRPKHTINDVISGRVSAYDAFNPTSSGVHVLCGAPGTPSLANTDYATLARSGCGYERFQSHYDYLIVDTGSSLDHKALSFHQLADEVLLVGTPSMESMHDSYVMASCLKCSNRDVNISFLMNQVCDKKEARQLSSRFLAYANDLPGRHLIDRGFVSESKSVVKAMSAGVPVSTLNTKEKLSKQFQQLSAQYSPSLKIETQAKKVAWAKAASE